MYLATVRGMTRAAALDCRVRNGIAVPNPVLTNAAKFYFADNYHAAVKYVQDIAGGLVVTGPGADDFNHPELRPLLDHYLAGKAGISGEERLRAMNLARDLIASDLGGYLEILAIHAEGSLETQKLTVLMDTDLGPLKAYTRWLAGISAERPAGRPLIS
jgi:aromatic ring hydroxylase